MVGRRGYGWILCIDPFRRADAELTRHWRQHRDCHIAPSGDNVTSCDTSNPWSPHKSLSGCSDRISVRRAWRAIAVAVMRRPWPVIVLVAVAIGVLTIPAFPLRVGIPGPEILPSSVDSRAGNDLLQRHLSYVISLGVGSRSAFHPELVRPRRIPPLFRLYGSAPPPDVMGVASVPFADHPSQIRSCGQAATHCKVRRPPSPLVSVRRQRVVRLHCFQCFYDRTHLSAASENYVAALRHGTGTRGTGC